MQKIFTLLTFFTIIIFNSSAQQAIVNGHLSDSKTGEDMVGAHIIYGSGLGTATDIFGNYELKLDAGTYTLKFGALNHKELSQTITLKSGETKILDVKLEPDVLEMNIVTVVGGKYEKKLGEETVSIEVLKPDLINNSNAIDMEEAMDKVPGVSVIDGQANIRGGSGWSYGAGSRVLILVDDMPLLSADAADAKWSFIPTENIEQVEVLKGASSALYGSSALNGIIHIRTAWPRQEPFARIILYQGVYGNFRNKEIQWWGNDQPAFSGGSFAYRQRFGRFDLVTGGNYAVDKSYLKLGSSQSARVNFETRWRPKNLDGLSVGINGNFYKGSGTTFFLWNGSDSLSLVPLPGSESNYYSTRITVDPFVTYFDNHGNKYSLRTRWFNAKNENDTEQGSNPNLYYAEAQYQRTFDSLGINFITGVSGYYSNVTSPTGVDSSSLFGSHNGNNVSGYLQIDKKFWDRLSLSFGVRYEYFRIDTFTGDSKPVLRFGVNYRIAKVTYIRASVGQGYRFPTIAEKFVQTDVGGIGIYPNPKLRPETGFSAEVGIKQGFKISDWLGFLDLAAFYNEYNDMMEFTFGQYAEDKSLGNFLGLGFSSQNIGDTRIVGGEISVIGQGEIAGCKTTLLAGYTYINPTSLNWNDTLVLFDVNGDTVYLPYPGDQGLTVYDSPTYSSSSSSEKNILKYRNVHTVRADVETEINKFSIGVSAQYMSFMENIDQIFVSPFLAGTDSTAGLEAQLGTEAFSALRDYREENNKGNRQIDVRVGYHITDKAKVIFLVKNLLNQEMTRRPAYISAPINYTVQFSVEF